MIRTVKFLLALAITALFAISCGDDEPTNPKTDKNYIKIGSKEYLIDLGALTSNDSKQSTRAEETTVKYMTPIAFSTEGLSFEEQNGFQVKGEGHLFVINLFSNSLTKLQEGVHKLGKGQSMGASIKVKIVDTNTPPQFSDLVYIQEGTVEVKTSGDEYEISIKCKGRDLSGIKNLESLENVDATNLLGLLSGLKTVEIEGHFKGKLLVFTNVDWSKYLDIDKFKEYLDKIPSI